MKTIGIIVEYNPFHNGHLYHLQKAKELSNADRVVVVMSGHFVERGEPAYLSKWDRAELAIQFGVDLVVELPFAYAVQSADLFALGSISILKELQVSELYFGSETNNINDLYQVVELMETDAYHKTMKTFMDEGNSYPSAFGKTIHALTDYHFTSNDNLGIQYLNAIKKLNANIKAYTIERTGAHYLEETANHDSIASATAIRNMNDAYDYVPKETYLKLQGKTYRLNDYYSLIQYKIRSTDDFSNYYLIDEGIENRFKKALDAPDITSFLEAVYTRRYTRNRIRRTLVHLLMDVTKDQIKSFHLELGVPYIRIIGMNETGQSILNEIKKEITIPIYTKVKDGLHPMLDLELKVSNIYDSKLYQKEFMMCVYKKGN